MRVFDEKLKERRTDVDYFNARRKVIEAVFDRLVGDSPDDDARTAKPKKKRRSRAGS